MEHNTGDGRRCLSAQWVLVLAGSILASIAILSGAAVHYSLTGRRSSLLSLRGFAMTLAMFSLCTLVAMGLARSYRKRRSVIGSQPIPDGDGKR